MVEKVMKKDELKRTDVTERVCFFGRDGSTGPIDVWPTASRDESGELRYHFTLTNAERLVFPTDFPVIVQVLAWSALIIATNQKQLIDHNQWSSACKQIWELERLFNLP
jgi:hypothetical protein